MVKPIEAFIFDMFNFYFSQRNGSLYPRENFAERNQTTTDYQAVHRDKGNRKLSTKSYIMGFLQNFSSTISFYQITTLNNRRSLVRLQQFPSTKSPH